MWILAGTGLKYSRDYMCILRDRVQKVYPNLEDNTILLCPELITIVRPIFVSGFDVNSFLLRVVLIPKLYIFRQIR